ncbi:MAG: glycosyltransferase [Bacteroidota bacterium]|jgi:glycosyltransferase involved in cell wall biosynthesis|nr:glycosyltransferase [Bacteroidota bacterium]
MNPACSLVIAVYHRPEYLRLILAAYARQSRRDFEIIIADDGSGPEIGAVVEDGRVRHGLTIQHLWHEDRGWRKNVMLNNAIRAARSDYLIFTDGDCLPHRDFIADHLAERAPDRYLCGRRVETSARWTAALRMDDVVRGRFERLGPHLWWEGITGRARRVEDGLRFESPRLRNILHRAQRGMLGSNFSVSRDALHAVNGFDEEYDGPGCGEDSDIALRLDLWGLVAHSLRHRAIQFHLHHPVTRVPRRCLDRFEALRRAPRVRCRRGLACIDAPIAQDHE